MYYYNKKSAKKIIHTFECFHIVNTCIEDIGWFETLKEAYQQGYRFCKHCNSLFKYYKAENKEIIDFCRKNGLSVILRNKNILVCSIKSNWKITLDKNNRIVLYHKNEFETNRDYLSEINGYHLQGDARRDSIVSYLNYIIRHDDYRMQNPIYISKKEKESPHPEKEQNDIKAYSEELKSTNAKRQLEMFLILLIH